MTAGAGGIGLKKYIVSYMVAIFLALSLLLGGATFYLFSLSYQKLQRQDMETQLSILTSTQITDFAAFAKSLSGAPLRVTFIARDGTVLGDSDAGEIEENHAWRPEIVQAQQEGTGENVRRSTTDGQTYRYMATAYNDEVWVRIAAPQFGYENMQLSVLLWISLTCAGVLLLSLLTARLVARRLSLPVQALAQDVEHITAGDYQTVAGAHGLVELEPIAQNINQMKGTLLQHIYQLREQNTKINHILAAMNEGFVALDDERRITIINQRAKEYLGLANEVQPGDWIVQAVQDRRLLEALDQVWNRKESAFLDRRENGRDIRVFISSVDRGGIVLLLTDITESKKMERMRSEFTANVSHELKTPLTSIRGFVETLLDGAVKDEAAAQQFLQIILEETDRLSRLIQDTLELSRLESMASDVQLDLFDMREIVDEVQQITASAAKKADVTIQVQCDQIMVFANRDRMVQLVLNLVDNAVKYNKPGGSVSVSVTVEIPYVVLTVRDNGIGMKDTSRIFERFYSADQSRSKKVGGTGLGLSIVKHIVSLYQGTIQVDSWPGVGSVFTVRLRALPPKTVDRPNRNTYNKKR